MGDVPGTRTLEFPVPGMIRESAVAWLADGRPSGPTPRPSSTVMLLRPGPASGALEVFMLRRVATMAFAPSMWVFPGGGVDPRDADVDLPWAGPTPERWGELMGVPPDVAAQFVIAAAREVFEECGILLAGPDERSVVTDVAGDGWRAERDALLAKEQSFAQLLAHRGLVLRSDLLAVRDHWVTPECEPRRYDTWFFAARLPDRQVADDDTTEADRGGWVAPQRLLSMADDGAARLLPPTIVQLRLLAGAAPDDFMRHRPRPVAAMPVPTSVDEGIVMRVAVTVD